MELNNLQALLNVAKDYAVAVCSSFPDTIEILLFGSVSTNNCHTWSDIDIAVIIDCPNELEMNSKLYDIAISKGMFRVHPVSISVSDYKENETDGFLHEVRKGISLITAKKH